MSSTGHSFPPSQPVVLRRRRASSTDDDLHDAHDERNSVGSEPGKRARMDADTQSQHAAPLPRLPLSAYTSFRRSDAPIHGAGRVHANATSTMMASSSSSSSSSSRRHFSSSVNVPAEQPKSPRKTPSPTIVISDSSSQSDDSDGETRRLQPSRKPSSSSAAPVSSTAAAAQTVSVAPVAPSPPSKDANAAQTFGFQLTRAGGINEWFNRNAFSLRQLLSDMDLQSSVQFNYMVDLDWLMTIFPRELQARPMTVVHGLTESADVLQAAGKKWGKTIIRPPLPIAFGTHHTKMMFLFYSDSMRIVIHTANIIPSDWYAKTEGVWCSPKFPLKASTAQQASSSTGRAFEQTLNKYLTAYGSCIRQVREQAMKYDFSAANVALIASVPGRHAGLAKSEWGHMQLRKLPLPANVASQPVNTHQLIGQFSSIGSLGASPETWLTSEFSVSLSAHKAQGLSPPIAHPRALRLIFPSVENVRLSLEGYLAGGALPYRLATHSKQAWLDQFFCTWNATRSGRQHAMPHIKSYARIAVSPKTADSAQQAEATDSTNVALGWFLLTSANLSKAAWGTLQKKGTAAEQLEIRSYELGVLFHPSLMFQVLLLLLLLLLLLEPEECCGRDDLFQLF
ncbi:tyrosyl-DNA phosphodiesterase 1 [Capsaspora owczarzaki ATCC 30864]|uniref:tyrosyl-DNA phosphodiesterase 1 n=1 Tax=Capsaspora owczarzaki (strain ATCC 30864) TaxID=595528 RepID=UPI0001FE345B|nr:tyrosyl-DNA phosphodiesterase 1 [Capsaspora owczarzaki ATCC 30864]|eukprot:XP_004343834.1 tyrosyl-DNA phosphodiesterase 1 [Capsaspora owczarzaki ATCC 30864]